MDPKEVYKTYKAAVAAADEVLKQGTAEATAAYGQTVSAAVDAFIKALDAAVAQFREDAK